MNQKEQNKTKVKVSKGAKRRRRRRIKQVLALFIVLLFIGNLIPLSASQVAPERPTSSYGVEKELADLQSKRHSQKWEDIVKSEAEGDLDAIDITKVDKPDVTIDEQIILMGPRPPDDPDIYSIVETTTLPDRMTLIEYLISRPSSYYIYTECNGVEQWSQGLLRPDDMFLQIWDTWVEIDVDNDPDTGDDNGNDIRAKLDIELLIDRNNLLQYIEFPKFLPPTPAKLKVPGGLKLEVEKLSGDNATAHLPLDIVVVKSFSYTGNNFLWMVGFEWSDMPNHMKANLSASQITLQRPTLDLNFDPTNPSLWDESNIVNISGPYNITVDQDIRPPDLKITVAYAKVWLLSLEEQSWTEIRLEPASGLNRIPETFVIYLESPSFDKSFDLLEWTSTIPTRLGITFKEVKVNTTHAEILIEDMPSLLHIELNDLGGVGPDRATNVYYMASDRISILDFSEFEYYEHSLDNYTHSHAILTDIPTEFHLNGTFDIGGGDEPEPSNLAIGLVANFMDNTMLKISSKLARVARTLRTIPTNIINMPEKNGWASLVVTEGQYIGGLEFYVSSKSRIEAEGDYLAFRNDTRELNLGSAPLITSSLSGRLTDLGRITLDFRDGTVLALNVMDPRPFRIMFIDDANDARATLNIDEVPEFFFLSFQPNKIHISSNEPVETLSYESQVGDQYFRLLLEGVPTDFKIDQQDGRMKLTVPTDQYITSFSIVVTDRDRMTILDDNYNHIYLDRTSTSYFTSIALNMIRSLDMQTAAGGLVNADFAEEMDLYMSLTDTSLDIETKMLFKPFPSNFTIELPQGFTSSGIRLPNVLNVTSIFAFSPIILQMSQLADDIVTMTTELTSNIADQLGGIGTNTTIKLKSKVPTKLIADMRQGPAEEVKWLHGLNIKIDKDRNAIRARIYLRLPLEATIEMTSEGDLMDIHVNFVQFDPLWDFLDIRISGMEDKDISLYFDSLPLEPHDIDIDAVLDTNMTPGTGTVVADITITSDQDLGPLYLHMRKIGDVTSLTTLYMSSVAKRLECHLDVSTKLDMKWSASSVTKNVYALVQKLVDGEWHDVTMTLNKVPTQLNIVAGSPSGVTPDMDGTMLQGLPEISITGSTASLSLYIYMEGPAMGQPSTYEIHMRDVTDDTFTVFDQSNGIYKISSQGTGFIYMRIIDMPYQEKFQIREAEIYADEIYSVELKISEAFGMYPIIEVNNFDADSFQLRLKVKLYTFGKLREGNIIFVDISTRGGLPRSGQFTKNGISVTGGEHHTIIAAPIATMMATLLSGG